MLEQMTPWLSVIIPIQNGQQFIAQTLTSAVNEDPKGVEFIILDTSDDISGSFEIINKFSKDLYLVWINCRDLTTWMAKTNRGIEAARAQYICMLHCDDLWFPGYLTAIRWAIETNPNFSMSIAPSMFIDERGQLIGRWGLPFTNEMVASSEFLSALLVQNFIAVPSPVIRRDLWIEIGGLDENLNYTADWDLYLKLGKYGRIHVRQLPLTAFRIHDSSLTIKIADDIVLFRDQLEFVLQRHIQIIPEINRAAIERLARLSIEVNCFLAAVSMKNNYQSSKLVTALLKIGPFGMLKYLKTSRLLDRLIPRLRIKIRKIRN